MIMLQGMASKKMVAGYVAFMVSNYLWLPMAAIINFTAISISRCDLLLKLSQSEWRCLRSTKRLHYTM
jgi:hypothetical protein